MIENRWKEAELLLRRNGQYEGEQENQELLGQGSIVHAYQQHTRYNIHINYMLSILTIPN
jgi:hypothetical protein